MAKRQSSGKNQKKEIDFIQYGSLFKDLILSLYPLEDTAVFNSFHSLVQWPLNALCTYYLQYLLYADNQAPAETDTEWDHGMVH